MTLKYSK